AGTKTPIGGGWPGDFIDLAWSPDGREIWFDTRQGGSDGLLAIPAGGGGPTRPLMPSAVPLQLFDVAADGRLLAARSYWRSGILAKRATATQEEDLSWLDAPEVDHLAYDGGSLLITEFGEGGGSG